MLFNKGLYMTKITPKRVLNIYRFQNMSLKERLYSEMYDFNVIMYNLLVIAVDWTGK